MGNLSAPRLRRMHDALAPLVERGELPGFVTLVERRGEVHVDCVGYSRDTIFRIASMSKPIVAAAACILIEEGRLHLDDSVEQLLPELAALRVLRSIDSEVDDTVPKIRPITLRHLLAFTLGAGMIFAEKGTYPIQKAMEGSDLSNRRKLTPDQYMRALAELPLVHQPGEAWLYNTGSEVLGILIGRATRMSLGDFMRERLFQPLGMKDSGFWVPAAKIDRLPTAYAKPGGPETEDKGKGGSFSRPPALESGGGGLVATVDDFHVFARMLLNGGVMGAERILSRPTIEAMTSDQLTPSQKANSPWNAGAWDNESWGWGVGVVTRRSETNTTPGAYGWRGGYGTAWRSDPSEDMVAILMTQVVGMTAGPDSLPVPRDFFSLAYAAIDD